MVLMTWIYFKQEDNTFHDEILICDVYELYKYLYYYKI